MRESGKRLDVFLRDEVVDCLQSPAAIASLTTRVALASASAKRSRASASRNAASRRPSASRIWACFPPSP